MPAQRRRPCRSVSSCRTRVRAGPTPRRLAGLLACLAAIVVSDVRELAAQTIPPLAAASASNGARTGNPAMATELFALTVRMNQTETGLVLPVMRRDGRWSIDRDELARLPAQPPQGWAALPPVVSLDQEGGFETSFDPNEQVLDLTVPASWLAHQVTKMGDPFAETPVPPMTGPAGLVVNYDVNYSQSIDFSQPDSNVGRLAALTEIRWFNQGTGVLSHTQLNQVGQGGEGSGWRGSSVRLDTSWQETRPDAMVKWRFGDGITDSGTGMRPIRFGGIWIGSDFSLQPYRTTSALPSWFGSVALPSTVDVYIDGMRRYHAQVPPGAVALDAVPGVTGAGMATVVLTDVLGRMQTIQMPFYSTTRLLKAGMADWSASLGVARLDYGQASNHYGSSLIGTGRIRYGFSSAVTGEIAAEATEGVRTLSMLGVVSLGQLGVLAPRISASDATPFGEPGILGGSQLGLGYEWSNRRFSVNADYARATPNYRDVASLYGSYWAHRTKRIGLGWNLGQQGMLGLSWIRQIESTGNEGRYLSASWYRNLAPDWGVQVTVSQSLAMRDETLVMLGVTRMLGNRRTATGSQQIGRDRYSTSVSLAQSMSADDRESWRVLASSGNGDPSAQVDLAKEWSKFRGQAQLYSRGERLSGYAGAQGSLAWVGGHRLAARALPDAFALVTTEGVPDVPVRLENRLVGRTDGEGLLVAPLYGWISNRVSVDALELPADLRIDSVQQQVIGRGKAGSVVRFPMRRVRAATVILVNEIGRTLEQGATVTRIGPMPDSDKPAGASPPPDMAPSQIGYDGEVWLEELAEKNNQFEVIDGERHCIARFDFPPDASNPARIGPITCRQDETPEMI